MSCMLGEGGKGVKAGGAGEEGGRWKHERVPQSGPLEEEEEERTARKPWRARFERLICFPALCPFDPSREISHRIANCSRERSLFTDVRPMNEPRSQLDRQQPQESLLDEYLVTSLLTWPRADSISSLSPAFWAGLIMPGLVPVSFVPEFIAWNQSRS